MHWLKDSLDEIKWSMLATLAFSLLLFPLLNPLAILQESLNESLSWQPSTALVAIVTDLEVPLFTI